MSERFKFRIWDKYEKSYWLQSTIEQNIHWLMNPEEYKDANYPPDCVKIEQSTGLKDKNGKLIYEGDIVKIKVWDDIEEDMVETNGKVYWSREDAAFLIYVSYDGEYSLNSLETLYGKEIEVIGNIHQDEELLNE